MSPKNHHLKMHYPFQTSTVPVIPLLYLLFIDSIEPFKKRHKLIHNGRFPKFKVLHCSKILYNRSRFTKTLVTMYNLTNHKISGELKSCNSFWMYPPLWTRSLVAILCTVYLERRWDSLCFLL